MLSPLNILCSLGKLGFIGQSSRERGRDRVGSKQIHKSAEKVLDWRRCQSWGELGFTAQLQSCRKRLAQAWPENYRPWHFAQP